MATPKDYIVYIDKDDKTRACLNYSYISEESLVEEGNKIIGYVSSGSEAGAIAYADQVLR
jgi:hypothetical protein